MEDKSINVKIIFKSYSFEEDKTDCKKCSPPRTLIVANYDCIYFPAIGVTYSGLENSPLKVVIGAYKNLKDAKRALRLGRLRRRDIKFDVD